MADSKKQSLQKAQASSPSIAQVPLRGEELQLLQDQLGEGWETIEEQHLVKSFFFKDFKEALTFANMIGAIADEQNHHPELQISWGKLVVSLSTHSIGGLSEKDFLLATKIETEWISHKG